MPPDRLQEAYICAPETCCVKFDWVFILTTPQNCPSCVSMLQRLLPPLSFGGLLRAQAGLSAGLWGAPHLLHASLQGCYKHADGGSPCSTSTGTSRRQRPSTPRPRPTKPSSPSRSPKSSEASSATVNGWESMITLPSPAVVRCSPSARKPCACDSAQPGSA